MRGTRGGLLALALGLALLAVVGNGGAKTTVPDLLLLDPIGTFDHPTFVTSPPGDESRLFVVRQPGQIMLVKSTGTTTFMTVPNVFYDGGERGLLSLAFPPDYATSGLFYVYYTHSPDGNIQVDEFHRDASNPDLGDPSTRRAVITVPHPSQSNHNGGQLEFGPDGMLYMGTGDGGGGGDPFRTGQNLQDAARQDPAHRPAPERRGAVRGAGQQPVRGPGAVEAGDLGLRRPQPVALLVRPRHRRLHARRRRSEHLGGDRLPPDRRGVGARRQLRLELHGGAAPVRELPRAAERTRCRSTSTTTTSAACSITGGYVSRDQEVPSLLGPLRLRGLLQRPDLVEPARDSRRDRQPRGDGYLAPDHEPHFIRRGRVRPYVRRGPGRRAERVPDPAAGSARAVLHAAVRPAGPDRARGQRRLHDSPDVQRQRARRSDAAARRVPARARRQLGDRTTSIWSAAAVSCVPPQTLRVGGRGHGARDLDGQLHDRRG